MSEQPEVAVRVVSPEVWKTLKVPLKEGRDFGEADRAKTTGAVIVTETMAKRFWPGQSAVGKRLTLTFAPEVPREVVGVIADVKLLGLSHREPVAALFVPNAQMPMHSNHLVVRTSSSPESLARAVTAAVRAIDPEQPVEDVQTYEDFLGGTLAAPRFQVRLLSAFASLALLLAAAGIYGVVAYGVRRRTREIGIRVALGANAAAIVRLIVTQGMRPALLGLAAGAAASLALGRALSRLLFGIGAADPPTLAAVSALLAAVALAACVVPALRATRVDPTVALTEG
jgi:predicted permease